MTKDVPALVFDVFGTLVDWRGSIRAMLADFFQPRGISHDWERFALDWRALYQPSMQAVREGARDYVDLDHLHRENLEVLLDRYGISGLTAQEVGQVNLMWHRLEPWPDSAPGLRRLARRHILASLSNGNIALMVDLARHGDLRWDAILGADLARNYKPVPAVYLTAAAALGRAPQGCMMVAAHNDDLRAARALGFQTAFIPRPDEYGAAEGRDLTAEEPWDYVAGDLCDLARQLGL